MSSHSQLSFCNFFSFYLFIQRDNERLAVFFRYQLRHTNREMYSLHALLSTLALCNGITVIYNIQDHRDIVPNTKEELPPLFIPCGLNEIVIISAPIINLKEVAYYLYKPSGGSIKLDLPRPNTDKAKYALTATKFAEYEVKNSTDVIIQNINEYATVTYPKHIFKVLPLNLMSKDKRKRDTATDDSIKNAENSMAEYDFMIGPLLEEDHGNWVLSAYCRGRETEWIEIFQIITVAIIARVPMDQGEVTLKEGSTFNLSFAYSIKGLEACSLVAPESALDRYYDRNRLIEPDKCGYTVPNVTTHDAGTWKVTGVGPIVYEGYVVLYNEHRR